MAPPNWIELIFAVSPGPLVGFGATLRNLENGGQFAAIEKLEWAALNGLMPILPPETATP